MPIHTIDATPAAGASRRSITLVPADHGGIMVFAEEMWASSTNGRAPLFAGDLKAVLAFVADYYRPPYVSPPSLAAEAAAKAWSEQMESLGKSGGVYWEFDPNMPAANGPSPESFDDLDKAAAKPKPERPMDREMLIMKLETIADVPDGARLYFSAAEAAALLGALRDQADTHDPSRLEELLTSLAALKIAATIHVGETGAVVASFGTKNDPWPVEGGTAEKVFRWFRQTALERIRTR